MNRKKFIQQSGLLGAGFLLAKNSLMANPKAMGNFGLQLYTLRDDLPLDPKGVLKKVADFGYKQLEGYEADKGLWWGMTSGDFKKYLDDLGVTMVSSHCAWEDNLDKKAEEAAAVGLKYLICPWIGPQKSMDDFKRYADKFNTAGEICRKNGLRFAYHNHDYSFKRMDGQIPQEVMMGIADENLVDFEMDIYWVIYAGLDPLAYFSKYKNRFRLCHVKDRAPIAGNPNSFESVTLGTGNIDFKTILTAAKKDGMKYYIVEQEAYHGTTPLKAVEDDANYMKKLVF